MCQRQEGGVCWADWGYYLQTDTEPSVINHGRKRQGRIAVNRHFSEKEQGEEDVKIIGLERTWRNSEDLRKFREMRWVGLLGTQKDGDGENVRWEK